MLSAAKLPDRFGMREEVLLSNFGFGFLNDDLPGNSFPFGSDDEETVVGKDPLRDPL